MLGKRVLVLHVVREHVQLQRRPQFDSAPECRQRGTGAPRQVVLSTAPLQRRPVFHGQARQLRAVSVRPDQLTQRLHGVEQPRRPPAATRDRVAFDPQLIVFGARPVAELARGPSGPRLDGQPQPKRLGRGRRLRCRWFRRRQSRPLHFRGDQRNVVVAQRPRSVRAPGAAAGQTCPRPALPSWDTAPAAAHPLPPRVPTTRRCPATRSLPEATSPTTRRRSS